MLGFVDRKIFQSKSGFDHVGMGEPIHLGHGFLSPATLGNALLRFLVLYYFLLLLLLLLCSSRGDPMPVHHVVYKLIPSSFPRTGYSFDPYPRLSLALLLPFSLPCSSSTPKPPPFVPTMLPQPPALPRTPTVSASRWISTAPTSSQLPSATPFAEPIAPSALPRKSA